MKHLFFDLDGTLVDSSEGIINCFILTFKAVNLPVPDLTTLKTFIGPPLELTFSQYGDQFLVDKMLSTYRQHYRDEGVNQVAIFDGIEDCLTKLKSSGYQLYVATSKNQDMAVKMLADLSIDHYFDGVYGALETSYHKADILKRAIHDQQLNPRQALMIGDTHFDMVGGKTVGMACLGILWGFGDEEGLVKHGADAIIDSPAKLLDSLRLEF